MVNEVGVDVPAWVVIRAFKDDMTKNEAGDAYALTSEAMDELLDRVIAVLKQMEVS